MHRNCLWIFFLSFSLVGCAKKYPLGQTEYLYGLGPANLLKEKRHSPRDTVSYWDGQGISGRPSLRINLSEQKAYFYKGTQLVGVARVSTGREGYRTPTGTFSIIQKNKDHTSNLYGDFVDQHGHVVVKDVAIRKDTPPPGTQFRGSPMPYFLRIVGGVGMHAGYLPGYPASHGCIRLPTWIAKHFFENVSIGTPVVITY